MGLTSTIGAGALATGLAALAALPPSQVKPASPPQENAAQPASESTPWRTDLAAAMAEARRTKRPLLAVFR